MAVKSSAILTLIRIDDASIRSATAPSDTTKLWFDTTTQTLKRYDSSSGTWEIVNDYADDMNNMRQEISVEYNSAITQLKNSLTSLVEELQTTTTNNTTNNTNGTNNVVNNTEKLPQTGLTEDITIMFFIVLCVASAVFAYVKIRKYNEK